MAAYVIRLLADAPVEPPRSSSLIRLSARTPAEAIEQARQALTADRAPGGWSNVRVFDNRTGVVIWESESVSPA